MNKKVFGLSFPILLLILVIFFVLALYGLIIGPIGAKIFGQHFAPSWLYLAEAPEPELAPGILFHIGSFPVTNTMVTAWITIIILVLLTFFAFRRPKLVPAGLQKVMEFIYNALLDFCISVAGEKNGRRFFPFVATIFLFVITNAYLGLLPFFGDAFYITNAEGHHIALLRAANTDINVPLALALFAWVSIETFGIKSNGFFSYMKKFLNYRRIGAGFGKVCKKNIGAGCGDILFGVIDIFVGILELISEFIRLISFTFRLFGNMTAGEVLVLIVAFLAPFMIGIFVYGLETLVGFVQALIFGGLTLVWMTTAVEKHGGEEEHS
jgi:F-type H+-transporting ATPase subunit a